MAPASRRNQLDLLSTSLGKHGLDVHVRLDGDLVAVRVEPLDPDDQVEVGVGVTGAAQSQFLDDLFVQRAILNV